MVYRETLNYMTFTCALNDKQLCYIYNGKLVKVLIQLRLLVKCQEGKCY